MPFATGATPPRPSYDTVTGEQPMLDPEILIACASASLRAHAFNDAYALLTAALALESDHPRALAMLGLTLDRLNRPLEARDAYERAITAEERDPHTLLELARLYIDSGEEDRARSLLSWLLVELTEASVARRHALDMLSMLEARK